MRLLVELESEAGGRAAAPHATEPASQKRARLEDAKVRGGLFDGCLSVNSASNCACVTQLVSVACCRAAQAGKQLSCAAAQSGAEARGYDVRACARLLTIRAAVTTCALCRPHLSASRLRCTKPLPATKLLSAPRLSVRLRKRGCTPGRRTRRLQLCGNVASWRATWTASMQETWSKATARAELLLPWRQMRRSTLRMVVLQPRRTMQLTRLPPAAA